MSPATASAAPATAAPTSAAPASAAPATISATSALAAREACVRRLLDRYLIEVVEAWGLCPWAFGARQKAELAVELHWGPDCEPAVAAELARHALHQRGARVVMLVFPELRGGGPIIEALRDELALLVPEAGVAAFGPHGGLDLSTPAKLVPLLRRSPDPMLQLVPFTILDELRAPLRPAELGQQARLLAGLVAPPPPSMIDNIARRNHAVVAPDGAARLLRALTELSSDRAASYAAAGIRLAGE